VPEVKVSQDGTVAVPNKIGLGFELDFDFIKSQTETIELITSSR